MWGCILCLKFETASAIFDYIVPYNSSAVKFPIGCTVIFVNVGLASLIIVVFFPKSQIFRDRILGGSFLN